MVVVAGDDENGGAASVTEGAAATAVLGVGEEDGEVRHGSVQSAPFDRKRR